MKTLSPMSARALRFAAVAAAVLVAAGSALADNDHGNNGNAYGNSANREPTVAEPTNGNITPGTLDNFDVYYNVCRGTDPRCYHPWVARAQRRSCCSRAPPARATPTSAPPWPPARTRS